jgi:predicted permease
MGTFWQDLRYGLRVLVKSPGFTIVAVITLALGIGANTAIFGVIDGLLLRPLPVKNSGQLVNVYTAMKKKVLFIRDIPLSYPQYQDIVRQSRSFSSLLAYRTVPIAFERHGASRLITGAVVTANYFDTLGVGAVMGRTFTAASVARQGDGDAAVIGYNTWLRDFDADPAILGKPMDLNGKLFTIIGVAPSYFHGLALLPSPQVWVPITADSMRTVVHGSLTKRGSHQFWTVGRLKPGVTMTRAGTELETIADRLARQYPKTDKDQSIAVFHANDVKLLPDMNKQMYGASLVLMVVVGLVLLIACANVAAMSLARATSRRKELAVRMAVGAGRWRLVRQLLTESLLLALMGGAFAVLLTFVFNRELLRGLNSLPLMTEMNVVLGVRVDLRVLGFTLLVVALTTALFGLAPALQASCTSPGDALKEEGRSGGGGTGKHRLLNALVVVQVAVSLLLLLCSGLSLRSVWHAYRVQPGFDIHNAVTATFLPTIIDYKPAQAAAFYRSLERRVKALPGVVDAGYASNLPLSFNIEIDGVTMPGKAGTPKAQWPQIDNNEAGPGYFAAMRIPILRGRPFNDQDVATAPPVAIVNQTFARRFWPGENPIGKRLLINNRKKDYVVVGVVANGKYRTLGESPRPFVYRCILQQDGSDRLIVVRTAGNPAGTLPAIRRIASQLDPKVPVISLETLAEATTPAFILPKVAADFFGLAGLLALVLACVGIYGVISYSVNQRTHEIGIRVALGAQRSDVARLVLGRSLGLTLLGVGIGLGGALALTRVLSGILYGISATDPVTFVGVPLLLILVALAACYIPARRAMRVDPMVALRYE